MNLKIFVYAVFIFSLMACKDSFLDEKPTSSIINPKSLEECRALLDNDGQLGKGLSYWFPSIVQLASDEYYYDKQTWMAISSAYERNIYLWEDRIEESSSMDEWGNSFYAIYITNVVLNVLENIEITALNEKEYKDIKGTALFFRAMWNFALAETFCMPYSKESAANELGIPLRKSPNINQVQHRSTLDETYTAILEDLKVALTLVQNELPSSIKNRPSLVATNALLARVYLVMADYDNAYKHASDSFNAYNVLLDYNTLNLDGDAVFNLNNPEVLLMSHMRGYSSTSIGRLAPNTYVDSTLIALYHPKDLRLQAYFTFSNIGNLANRKNLYTTGTSTTNLFNGMATDEVLLVLAECRARSKDLSGTKSLLEKLYQNRFPQIDVPTVIFKDKQDALQQVLDERRKELLFRGMRWSDVRRLNIEGRNISLNRRFGNDEYVLEPNSLKYAFLIPFQEIQFSNLTQNKR